jgi:hypothetical protein
MKAYAMGSVSDIVDALGGTSMTAGLLHVSPQAVSNWRARNAFPAHTYVQLHARLALLNLTAPDRLWKMHPQQWRRRKPQGQGQ